MTAYLSNMVLPRTEQWKYIIELSRAADGTSEESDSGICKGGEGGIGCDNCAEYDCRHCYDNEFKVGKRDYELLLRQVTNGTNIGNMIKSSLLVFLNIDASVDWWMDFGSCLGGLEHVFCDGTKTDLFKESLVIDEDGNFWFKEAPIDNRKIAVILDYKTLSKVYKVCKRQHKFDRLDGFCAWIEYLPFSKIITSKTKTERSLGFGPIEKED